MTNIAPLFTLVEAKGFISIQTTTDLARQHLGFSASGAADEHALLTANKIIGNELNAHALELCFAKLEFIIEQTVTIIFTGANCQPQINGEAISMLQPIELNIGDRVTTQFASDGNYSYMAIRGGFIAPQRFASKSLSALDKKEISSQLLISNQAFKPLLDTRSTSERVLLNNYHNFYASESLTVRFIPHQTWQELNKHQQARFLSSEYSIDSSSNKMGIRLSGDKIMLSKMNNILSKPVCYGTIQLPSNGQPLVLMKDRQTIGGYPTLGAVMQVDLFRLAQMRPSSKIKFVPTSVEQAQNQLASFYQKFR